MVGSFFRLAAAAAFSALLAGCATAPDNNFPRAMPKQGAVMTVPGKPISCVPYARAHSAIDIRGDAYTWWDKAQGHFRRSAAPSPGSVIVLAGYAGSKRAHVAVVRRVVSAREIRVDHANWLNNGAVFLDDPIADISSANDWSQVLVWNIETNSWGTHAYKVQGFIGPRGQDDPIRLARRDPDEY